MIYVIGLGQNTGDLSVNGQKMISFCDLIVVKTAFAPTYRYFEEHGIKHVTCDEIQKKSKDFESYNDGIYKFLKLKEKTFSKIAYCVDGSGYDDKSVEYLFKNDPTIKIYEAASKGSGIFASSSVRYSADDIIEGKLSPSSLPLSIFEIENKGIATKVKAKLLDLLDEDTNIVFASAKDRAVIKLADLDKQFNYNLSTRISIDTQPLATKKMFHYYDLIDIMKVLRKDCPWDSAQTNKTLRMEVLNVAYEVVDSIDRENDDKLLVDLGELLLQAVFHALIAESRNAFSNSEVISSVCKSLILKHQHIFLSGAAAADESLAKLGKMEQGQHETVYKEILAMPKTYPALTKALRVQKKANKIGFEICQKFMNFTRINSKVEELKNTEPNNVEKIQTVVGELLFLIVNVLRQYEIEPELALSNVTEKFIEDLAKFEGLLYNQP